MAAEVCQNFNAKAGKCAKDGPCPHGRKHVCSVCGEAHRAIDKHFKAAKPKAQADKGRGKRR